MQNDVPSSVRILARIGVPHPDFPSSLVVRIREPSGLNEAERTMLSCRSVSRSE